MKTATKRQKKFHKKYPSLTESTVRNFKKRYLQRMALERKKLNPEPLTTICNKERGRPPLLLELDDKLVSFLKAVRIKVGVVNIRVVRATAHAGSDCKQHNIQSAIRTIQNVQKLGSVCL